MVLRTLPLLNFGSEMQSRAPLSGSNIPDYDDEMVGKRWYHYVPLVGKSTDVKLLRLY